MVGILLSSFTCFAPRKFDLITRDLGVVHRKGFPDSEDQSNELGKPMR